MPLYLYKCRLCTTRSEILIKLADLDSTRVTCHRCAAEDCERQVVAPTVVGDFVGYDCPITGKWIEGRRAHKENLKQHGCRVFEPGEREEFIRNRRKDDDALDHAVGETAEQFVHELPTDKREKLIAEVQAGADAQFIRTSGAKV